MSTTPLSDHRWIIIGCGFTGKRLARRLLDAGAEVWATKRSEDGARQLAEQLGRHERLHTRAVELGDRAGLMGWMPQRAILVHSAPPSDNAAENNLIAAAADAQVARIVYISSTGVYPPSDGSWVTEDSPVGPTGDRGRARLAAETAVLDRARERGIPAVSLRASGIYGPGRGVHARLRAGTYRVIGAGNTYVNRIHVDDLVSVVIAAAQIPALPRTIYNVADDRPETSRVHGDGAAELMGLPRPPSVPVSEVSPRVAIMLGANRRIANSRIKDELGVTLAYPTWREGLAQALVEDGIPRGDGQ